MAQQARPNDAGHSEDLRDQLTIFSTLVRTTPFGIVSSRPMDLVPFQSAASPDVAVRDEHREDEQHHLDEAEDPELVEGDRPGVEEDHLDVEDDEEHGGQ